MKSLLGAVAPLGLAALAAGCGSATEERPPSGASGSGGGHETGTIAADFTASDVDGKTFRLSDHLGRDVVLLDFWATFCEPCKAEFPHLRELYAKYKSKGLLVVGVSMDGPETVADVHAFVQRFELDFPIVTDTDSRIASLYDPKKSMPLSVLIGRSGRVAVVREGYTPGEETLIAADVAKELTAGEPAAAP